MCCCHRKGMKVFVSIVILIAVLLAIGISMFNVDSMSPYVAYVGHFFDIMIPILAAGALIKYLLTCACPCHHKECEESCKKEMGKTCCSSEEHKNQ